MSFLDISLLVILGVFVVNGLFKGVIRLIGHLVSLAVGAWLSTQYYLAVYNWLEGLPWFHTWMSTHVNLAQVLTFIIMFAVLVRFIVWGFIILEKIFKFVAVIPGSRYINNLLGAALGFLEGSLFLGLTFYVINYYPLVANMFGPGLKDSVVVPLLLKTVGLILPLLPAAFKAVKSVTTA